LLVLRAVRALGNAAPARLRGVFAAVVWDGTTLRCFRDQLGLRPLFYREQDGVLFAAMEAKQVVAGAGISAEPDIDALVATLYGRTSDDMGAALRGVRRLPKGTVLEARPGAGLRAQRYWHPERLLETARLSDA